MALVLGSGAPAHSNTAGLDWRGPGPLLAFWCDSGLYAANLDQGGVVRLSPRPLPGRSSPDGTRIAWSDNTGTYVWRAGSAGPIRVAEAGRVTDWSPDSRWVIAECATPGQAADIYMIAADGGGALPLAPDPAWDGAAVCSPDGRWIAFVSNRQADRSDIWVVGWDGSALTRVTSMPEAAEPAWSADGAKLAFCGRTTASSPRQTYCLDFNTRKLTTVTGAADGDCRDPRFFGPSYLTYRGRGRQLADLRTGAKRTLPAGDLSPDARLVATLSTSPGSLDVVNPNGEGRRSVDKGVEAFAWSPDGRWLAYLALTNGPGNTPVRELRINTLAGKGIYILWSEGLHSPEAR